MNKKQKEVELAKLKAEEKELKHLKAIYNKASDDIAKKLKISNGKINVLLKEFDNLDDTQKSILQSQIYQRNFQLSLKKQIDGFLSDLQKDQYKSIDEYLKGCYETGFLGSMYDLHGQGIPLVMPIDQKKAAAAIKLDPKISKNLYTKLGEDVGLLKKRIANNVSRGIATASEYKVIARNIAADSNVGFNRAMRIARTEGHGVQVQAAVDVQHKAKEKGADIVKMWDAALDGRTRESHRRVDGEIRELDEKFSNGMMYPSDSAGGAAEVVNCRCALLQRARWALDDDELETLKERAAYYGLDKTKNFDDFKSKYLKAAEELSVPKPAKVFKPAKTVKEAKDALSNTIGFRNIDDIDSMDEQLLIDNTNQLMRLESKFGAVHKSVFVDIDLDTGNFIGEVSSNRISPTSQYLTLNKKDYSDRSSFIKKESKHVKSGYSMPMSLTDEELPVANITHEYGHILQNTIKADYMQSLGWTQSDMFAFVDKKAKTDKAKYKWYADINKKIQDDCYDEIIAIAKKNNPSFDLDANISDYGKTNKGEFFAEVFMNSQLGKPNELGVAMNEWLKIKGYIKAEKVVENSAKSSTIVVHKSLGAAAKNYQVKLADSKQHTKLAENQKIEGKVFAGKGTDSEIRDRFRLESDYHISADEWGKVSGKGYVIVDGKKRLAELHWYEAEGEIYEIKVKRYLDES